MRTLDLGEFILLIPGQSALAEQARLSPGAALRRIGGAIEAHLAHSGPFDEWAARCLVRDADARIASNELICSYLRWCDLAQIDHEDRLNETGFGRRLTAMGFGKAKAANGRVLRLGCALNQAADAAIHRQLQTDRQSRFGWADHGGGDA